MILYYVAREVLRVVFRLFWRLEATGRENVPLDGPLIVACNHVSYLDPPALGIACPRRIAYMAKEELFRVPVLGPAIRAVGAYPVDRKGSAASAIKRSVEVLKTGGAVGIFPEGGRNPTGEKQPREGVALLASLAKAPVVPAYVCGSANAKRLGKITVAFGKPLALPGDRKATRDELSNFTEALMNEIRSLAEETGGNS